MNYIYIPDNYNEELININYSNKDEFLRAQVKYRMGIEKILCSMIDFKKIDEYVNSGDIKIPRVEDEGYNFYHKYSSLGSKYIFLRNNIHVERLSEEEIKMLKSDQELDSNFFLTTLDKVLYEGGDHVFYGTPIMENMAKSKSIVFEFSYDQKLVTELDQLRKVDKIKPQLLDKIGKIVKEKLNLDTSFVTYTAIPDEYKVAEKEDINIL